MKPKKAYAAVASNEDRWPNILSYITHRRKYEDIDNFVNTIELNGIRVDRRKYPAVQRIAASVKDKGRVLPKSVVIKVLVNGNPVRGLVDSGFLGEFMSTTLADQLKIQTR